jgi:ribosomal protein S18 acetylase RimI-like enzyme
MPAVRSAAPADLDLLVRFNAAMAQETEGKRLDPARLRAGVAAALEDPQRGRYLVAEHDGRAAGALLVTREWSDWRNGWFWWIQSVYVAPAARRQGVYRALHRAVLEEARADDTACGVRLYVEHENAAARRTYESLGMSETGYRLYEIDFTARRAPA